MSAFALLSVALSYPDDDLLAAREEVARAAEDLTSGDPLGRFLAWWAATPPGDLQRLYVETFDFARRNCLHMTYFTHGDRRQRGMALLALKRRYADAGLEILDAELPDHLAVMCEFAAIAPPEGRALLAEQRPMVELVRHSLHEDASPWADVLDALVAQLPELTDEERDTMRRLAADGPPREDVGLEPFAPPEVMPEPVRACAAMSNRPPAPVAAAAGRTA
ncbi:MAG: nitrate reductase molybdenum cofactor assembly chaperone [Actinomycetota bacterium]